MATSPLGALPDISRIPTVAPVDPLQTLIQGFTQGQAIRNLPQTLQDQALNQQLARAVALQKLQTLGQPEIINAGGGNLFIRDPTSPTGIRQVASAATKAVAPNINADLGVEFITDEFGRTVGRKIPMQGVPQVATQAPLTSVFDQAPVQIPEFNLPSSLGLQAAAQAPQSDLTNLIEAAVQQSAQPAQATESPFVTGTLAQREAASRLKEEAAARVREEQKQEERDFQSAKTLKDQQFIKGRDEARQDFDLKRDEAKAEAKPPKPLPKGISDRISDAKSAVDNLITLKSYIDSPEVQKISGPVAGRTIGQNPFSDVVGNFNGVRGTSKQVIGKYLEGGVMREADENKYEKIVPSLKMLTGVQQNQAKELYKTLKKKLNNDIASYEKSGYDVSDLKEYVNGLDNEFANVKARSSAEQAPANQSVVERLRQKHSVP